MNGGILLPDFGLIPITPAVFSPKPDQSGFGESETGANLFVRPLYPFWVGAGEVLKQVRASLWRETLTDLGMIWI